MIVGFCFAKQDTTVGRIGSIYILPTFQGKGIGQELIAQAVAYLGREKPIALEVVVYNTGAIGFYKKLGFIASGNENILSALVAKLFVSFDSMDSVATSGIS